MKKPEVKSPWPRLARSDVPNVGELVVATVSKIHEHGVYFSLDEYGGLEAYAPAVEVIQSWFRDIKDYVREGQKVVVKVIRVDPRRKLVDVSLKRVRQEEKERKFYEWKRLLRASKMFEIAARRVDRDPGDLVDEFWKLVEYFGDPLRPFEVAAKEGVGELMKVGIDEELAKAIEEVARQHIEVPPVMMSGVIKLLVVAPDGVEKVKNVLSWLEEALRKNFNVDVRLYTIGPPRYRIDIVGKDPRNLEEVFSKVNEMLASSVKGLPAEVSFTRIEREE